MLGPDSPLLSGEASKREINRAILTSFLDGLPISAVVGRKALDLLRLCASHPKSGKVQIRLTLATVSVIQKRLLSRDYCLRLRQRVP